MVNNIEQTWRQLICFQKARVENDSKMNGFYKHVRSLKILKKFKIKFMFQVYYYAILYQMRIYSALRNF